jgi:hypothetical protein
MADTKAEQFVWLKCLKCKKEDWEWELDNFTDTSLPNEFVQRNKIEQFCLSCNSNTLHDVLGLVEVTKKKQDMKEFLTKL